MSRTLIRPVRFQSVKAETTQEHPQRRASSFRSDLAHVPFHADDFQDVARVSGTLRPALADRRDENLEDVFQTGTTVALDPVVSATCAAGYLTVDGMHYRNLANVDILFVPSVVARVDQNIVFTTKHPDFANINVGLETPVWWDERLSA